METLFLFVNKELKVLNLESMQGKLYFYFSLFCEIFLVLCRFGSFKHLSVFIFLFMIDILMCLESIYLCMVLFVS